MPTDEPKQSVRYTCPNGDSWTSPVLTDAKITCPRCHEVFPADEVDVKTPSDKVSEND